MVLDSVHFVDAVDIENSLGEGVRRKRIESPSTCQFAFLSHSRCSFHSLSTLMMSAFVRAPGTCWFVATTISGTQGAAPDSS